MPKQSRSLSLDFLRGIAILLVLGKHANIYPNITHIPVLTDVLIKWNSIGWMGVDLFFVLSGFLVTGLLFKEYQSRNSIDFKRFYIRRGVKIYPAFYSLLVATVIYRIFYKNSLDISKLFSELFFVQNYFEGLCKAN